MCSDLSPPPFWKEWYVPDPLTQRNKATSWKNAVGVHVVKYQLSSTCRRAEGHFCHKRSRLPAGAPGQISTCVLVRAASVPYRFSHNKLADEADWCSHGAQKPFVFLRTRSLGGKILLLSLFPGELQFLIAGLRSSMFVTGCLWCLTSRKHNSAKINLST